ncbi:MAG: hypothetical protein IKN90_09290 [Treponema sp.]|nr:hypothetical protein [Treponema sp.]
MISSPLVLGIIFLAAALFFCTLAFIMGRPEAVKKTPLFKPSSFIFYLIGCLTFATGILFVTMRNELSKQAIQIIALVYLIILIVIFFIFIQMMGSKKK